MTKIENATQFYNAVKAYNHPAFYDYCVFFQNNVLKVCTQCGPSKAEAAKREAETKYMAVVTANKDLINFLFLTTKTEFYSSGQLFYKIS